MQQPSTLEELQDALAFIDASTSREEWVRVLMGIKNEFGDAAYDIADHWSQSGATYKPDGFKSTWKSIKNTGGTTIATVFKMAQDNGYVKSTTPISPEAQKKAQAEFAKRAIKREKEEKASAELERKWHLVISDLATKLWKEFTIEIKSNQYLNTKKVKSFGLRAFKTNLIIVMHDDVTTEIISDGASINAFFKSLPSDEERTFSFLHIKRSNLAIPLLDLEKRIWQLQIINSTGTKLFIKHGKKADCFFVIGKFTGAKHAAIAEGYATAATIHMATQWPCIIAFDNGNLPKVAKAFKAKFPNLEFVICADNDAGTKGNPGVESGKKAANIIGAKLAIPDFSELQIEEGA